MMKMYSYTKKNKSQKKVVMTCLMGALLMAVAGVSYFFTPTAAPSEDVAVGTNDVAIPVITLPQTEEKAARPYTVDAIIAKDFYKVNETQVANMTKFEGTYRPNQGIDYSFNNEAFEVIAIFSGEVSEVKEDPLFGHSCTITSGDVAITYQSLQDMKLVVGDTIKQGESLSLASANVYDKDLGNHLHLVVEQNGLRIDPEDIYGLTLEEIK